MAAATLRASACKLPGKVSRTRAHRAMRASANLEGPSQMDCAVGDPGLQVFTNCNLGNDKQSLLPKLSEIVARNLGKPESYVCIHLVDNQAMSWGGDVNAGCALGSCFSIGSINKENNAAISKEVMEALQPYGIDPAKFYIEFKDVAGENTGYKGSTFF